MRLPARADLGLSVPAPSVVGAGIDPAHEEVSGMAGRTMTIDCATCPVQHVACEGCMVTALQDVADGTLSTGEDLALDRREREVVSRLVAAGLVAPETATRARARHEPWSEYRDVAAG